MSRKTSKSVSRLLFLLTILFLFDTTIFAAPKSRENLLKQENEAINSSKTWTLDSVNQAIKQFEQTAADWEDSGDIPKSVFCLNEAAKLSQTTSDYTTAFRVLDKAIILSTKNNLIPEKTISLSLYALVSRQKGDTDKSSKYSAEALALSETVDSPIAKGYAYLSAGMHEFYFGKIERTKELFEKAESFAEQTADLELSTQILLYNGYTFGRDGDAVKGLKKMQLALQKSETADYRRGKALTYFGLGFLNMLLKEKQKAIVFYQKAEEIFPTDFEWLERAKLYTNFGVICEEYGDRDLAEIYREKAFLFYQKADYPLGEMSVLPVLARLKAQKGDQQTAKRLFDQAINLANENKSNFHLGFIRQSIGSTELNTGNYQEAIKNYQEALKIYREIGVNLSLVQNNLGKAYEKKGDYPAAKAFYNQALEINNQTKDHLSASENLFNLAKLNYLQGNVETSFEQINQSIEITESLYSEVINANLRRSYFSNVYDRYELLIHLLMQKHKELPDKGFDLQALLISEKSRSRSLLENLRLSEANFTKDAKPELVEREKEVRNLLNQNADKLTDLLSKKASEAETAKVENEIFSLENELENIKAKFKQESPIYSAIKNPATFDIAQFQQNVLDDKTLLLEFSLGDKESYLWIIGKKEISHVVLPARNVFERRIEKISQTFEARLPIPDEDAETRNKRIEESEKIFSQEILALSNDLLGQIAEKLGDKRLIVVPDGKLALMPLSALPIPNSNELLISRHEIVYQPSASFLNVITKIHNPSKSPFKDLLIFADPVFSDIDNRLLAKKEGTENIPTVFGLNLRDFRLFDAKGKIPRLFATQEEADSIAETVGKSRTTIVFGFDANRDRVLDPDLKDYRILHFATHGLIDIERPEVSGIVLSQFDENGQKREGFLRLQDIYALDLASDLVVLSACQTGIGKEIRGEGLMSLNNAFLQAGAKTVVSSAWKVDDGATAELMRDFYANLTSKHLAPSEALRQAQLKMSKSTQFSSPFYWAAFTIQGEFRQPISVSTSYFYYKLGMILIVFLVFAGSLFWYWRNKQLY